MGLTVKVTGIKQREVLENHADEDDAEEIFEEDS